MIIIDYHLFNSYFIISHLCLQITCIDALYRRIFELELKTV